MAKLHLYFPENDLALAAGVASYTPPPAALRLHRAGEALPLWYARPGDRFICSGINARWLSAMCETFGIADVDVYDHRDASLAADPWGWSAASRRAFADAGYPAGQLPDDAALARMRNLSHRRTAMLLARELRRRLPFAIAEPAEEATTPAQVEDYMRRGAAVIAKAPWSSSGRGLVRGRNMPREAFLQQAAGIIRRQGSVMLEREWDKTADFALLLDIAPDGTATTRGFSLFETNARGGYTANVLAPQPDIEARIGRFCDLAHLRDACSAIAALLPQLVAGYSGPVGVDMLAMPDGTIDAAVEVNLRRTMGFVALDFARYLAPGASGTLAVLPQPDTTAAAPIVENHLLAAGRLDLTPANPHFAFRATIH